MHVAIFSSIYFFVIILKKARNTDKFNLLIVGHSMGAGTGAILSILLKDKYPNLKCFAYSTPGGLLR
jgi:sn1-specific diacylglycerol lipase